MCCRYLKEGAIAEFQDEKQAQGRLVMVGQSVGFAVIKYNYTCQAQIEQRRRQRKQGEVVMVCVNVFQPALPRVGNLYMSKRNRTYRQKPEWVAAKHLTSFLHVAPDRDGDPTLENLVVISAM
jgi:hypothetical protein